ncbi:glycosyltransferase [Vibrio jasicida]|uniref:Glycosyltransferase n=1 Tax=Vibrio jasicida TaxID=766224 RepID=A0ABW7J8T9_9VIBR
MKKVDCSVIVPVFNGQKYIETFFEAINKQNYPSESFEVIFVNNNSNDNTYECLLKKINGHENYKVVNYKDRASSYSSRNYGVRFAKSHRILFTDIDCIPQPLWIRSIMEILSKENSCLISGGIKLFFNNTLPNVYELFDERYFLNQNAYAKERTGATANLATTLDVFNSVGGFKDVLSGGDRDFCRRVNEKENIKFHYAKDALVLHPARDTKKQILGKIERVSRGKAHLNKDKDFMFRVLSKIKNFIGMFIQLKQIKEVLLLIRSNRYGVRMKVKFSLFSFYCGFYARFLIFRGDA